MNGRNAQMKCFSANESALPIYRQIAIHPTDSKNQSRAITFLLYLMFTATCFAQKAAMPGAFLQFFDNNGAPCASCYIDTFLAGGTTPVTTYTVAGGGSSNANPIVLDSAGRAQIWLTPGTSYRFDLYGADAVLISSQDNIPGGSVLGQSTVTANYVLAGPTTGAAATPTFRALVSADIPANAANTSGNAATATALAANPTDCASTVLASGIAASGNLTCRAVVPADLGTGITARTALVNATAAAAAPTMGTTVDVLAYQVAEIPAFVFVASDFTTSGVGTALETITGLTWTIPASTALNVPFVCNFTYSQAVAVVAVAFGIQNVTVSPTNIAARGIIYTTTTASTAGNLPTLTTTSATAIVSATPMATATDYLAQISGLIEAPSNGSSSVIRIMVSTATAADLVTIRRGSSCRTN